VAYQIAVLTEEKIARKRFRKNRRVFERRVTAAVPLRNSRENGLKNRA